VIPNLVGDLIDRLWQVPSRIIDEDIDLAERRNRPFGQPFHFPAVRHVGRERHNFGVRFSANFGGGGFQFVLVPARDRYASARAMALPSPLLPPVTRAVRPERSKSVVDIGYTPSSFASMSKLNNCGILDKFGVPAQEQAEPKAIVDSTRS
jgi:hypothetical protein